MKLLLRVFASMKDAKSSADDVYAEKLLHPPTLPRRILLCGEVFSELNDDFELVYDAEKDVYSIDLVYSAKEMMFKHFVASLRSSGFEGTWETEAE